MLPKPKPKWCYGFANIYEIDVFANNFFNEGPIYLSVKSCSINLCLVMVFCSSKVEMEVRILNNFICAGLFNFETHLLSSLLLADSINNY